MSAKQPTPRELIVLREIINKIIFNVMESLVTLLPESNLLGRMKRFITNRSSLIICKDDIGCNHNPDIAPGDLSWYCKYFHYSQFLAIADMIHILHYMFPVKNIVFVIVSYHNDIDNKQLIPTFIESDEIRHFSIVEFSTLSADTVARSVETCDLIAKFLQENMLVSSFLMANILYPRPYKIAKNDQYSHMLLNSVQNFENLAKYSYVNIVRFYGTRSRRPAVVINDEHIITFNKMCLITNTMKYRFDEFAAVAQLASSPPANNVQQNIVAEDDESEYEPSVPQKMKNHVCG